MTNATNHPVSRIAPGMFAYRGYLLAGSRGNWSFGKNEADAPTTSGLTTKALALAAIDAIVDAPVTIK